MNWMVDGTPYSTPEDEREAWLEEQEYEDWLDSQDPDRFKELDDEEEIENITY